MRLTLSQASVHHHTDVVAAVGWTPTGELLSCSDDNTIGRWSTDGDNAGTVCKVDAAITAMHWFPSVGGQVSDLFAVSCTDGSFRIVSNTGREEKRVEAAAAAVISLRWNLDGSALATAGEDGAVKVWSRSGMLRSTIATCAHPVYAVVWGPDNDQILYASGRELTIKSLQVDRKQLSWKAHDGVVLSVDWNVVTSTIVSGGEDCKYKVWDRFGRQLFQSAPFEHVVTAVRWSPRGDTFAVGSYNLIRLCDKAGWSYSRESSESGSLLSLAWSVDGTQVAGAGGNGAVVFGRVVGAQLSWKNFEAQLVEPQQITVSDVFAESTEDLDFRDRVVDMALGFGHLVVATASQCYLYNVNSWNTPHVFDVRGSVSMISLCEKHFLMVDSVSGVQVYSYDGRALSSPRFPGLRVDLLSPSAISLGPDCVAIVDKSDGKTVRVFDVRTGNGVGTPVVHDAEVTSVALSQHAMGLPNRMLAFIDSNNDMFVTPVLVHKPVKVLSMVDSCAWNDVSDMLAACADGNLVTWLYPWGLYVDPDLDSHTKITEAAPQLGKLPQITTFYGTRVQARRGDGALVTMAVKPHPPLLYEFVAAARWDEAVRLARFCKEESLWGALAGMALHANHLDTAEVALAALNEVDKLHFILHIKDIPAAAGRNSQLALYKRNPDEAEKILLQANPPMVYRAIKLNIELFRWHRALDLAQQHRVHVATVAGYRQRFMTGLGRKESDPRFTGLDVEVDWAAIKAAKAEEKAKERRHLGYGAAPAGGRSGFGGPAAPAPAPASHTDYGGAGAPLEPSQPSYDDRVESKVSDDEAEEFKETALSDEDM